MHGFLLGCCLLASALWTACASTDVGEAERDAVEELDAAGQFALVEERLLSSSTVYLDFKITSAGAVVSDLSGTLVMQTGEVARLVGGGIFAGNKVNLRLASDGRRLSGGSAAGHFEEPTPRALREGLLLGLTRMGLLHNLAMLSSGRPPEATDGTARSWAKVTDVRRGKQKVEGERTLMSFHFGILVGGEPSGEAILWVDSETLLPVRRVQTVKFPEGEMRVVESYPLMDAEAD